MLGQLMPCGGGAPIPLFKPKLLLGRQSFCDVALRFATISSRHCELEFQDGYWFVRDLGSSNGTRVNAKPCASPQKLMPNDVLWLAQYRYTIAYTPPTEEPPAAPPVAQQSPAPPPAASEGRRPPPASSPARRAPVQAEPEEEESLGELVPCGGGDPIPLNKPHLIVGRQPTCDIVLRFGIVSGRHCQLDWDKGCWFVRDLDSHNGIRVDGVRCNSGQLRPGSVLAIATVRYQVLYTAPGREPERHPLFARTLLEKAGLTRWQGGPPTRKDDEDDEGPPRQVWRIDDFS